MTNQTNQTKVVTGEARLSYVHVFEPQDWGDGSTPKFSVTVLIPKTDTETVAKIKRATDAAIQAGISSKWSGKKPAKLAMPLYDGDSGEYGEEALGCWVVRAKSKDRPGVVDTSCNYILDSTQVYSGCFGRVSMSFFAYSAAGNNGVAAALNHVQKTRDGEPLGGRSSAESDFGIYESAGDGLDDLMGF